jgi:hypothetical protein
MMPIKEAIVGKLRESGPCSLDMSSRPSPISVGKRCSVPLMGCRETDGCYFAKAVTRPISFHLAHSVPTLRTPAQLLVSLDRQPDT